MLTDGAFGLLNTSCISPAAVSDIPYHAAHLMSSEGYTVEQRVFDRRTDEPAAE